MNQLLGIAAHTNRYRPYLKLLIPVALLISFVTGLLMLSQGLMQLPDFWRTTLAQSVKNPFVGLFIGMLGTSLIQSSSLSASLIVALTGSGIFSVESAIPVVVGANVGTVITVMINGLEADTNRHVFLRAASVVMLQDMFNLLTALLLLPLELKTHIWEQTLSQLPSFPVLFPVFSHAFGALPCGMGVLLGLLITASSVRVWITFWMRHRRKTTAKTFRRMLKGSIRQAFLYGLGCTATLQSSSRLIALFIGHIQNTAFSFRHVFTFLMGANIGTTVTALVAGLVLPFPALLIALTHFMFNLLGAAVLYFLPFARQSAIALAQYLGKAILQERLLGFAYIFTIFFLIPFLLITLSR